MGPFSPVVLGGIAIGNGYVDPVSQAGSELDMMVDAGLWSASGKVRYVLTRNTRQSGRC